MTAGLNSFKKTKMNKATLTWQYDIARIEDKFYCIEKFSYADKYRCELWDNVPEGDDPVWSTIGSYEEVKTAAEEHFKTLNL